MSEQPEIKRYWCGPQITPARGGSWVRYSDHIAVKEDQEARAAQAERLQHVAEKEARRQVEEKDRELEAALEIREKLDAIHNDICTVSKLREARRHVYADLRAQLRAIVNDLYYEYRDQEGDFAKGILHAVSKVKDGMELDG